MGVHILTALLGAVVAMGLSWVALEGMSRLDSAKKPPAHDATLRLAKRA